MTNPDVTAWYSPQVAIIGYGWAARVVDPDGLVVWIQAGYGSQPEAAEAAAGVVEALQAQWWTNV